MQIPSVLSQMAMDAPRLSSQERLHICCPDNISLPNCSSSCQCINLPLRTNLTHVNQKLLVQPAGQDLAIHLPSITRDLL